MKQVEEEKEINQAYLSVMGSFCELRANNA
jgi:hypothetical protein